jgi:acetylornithine deacetylase/succinyl-diaminopimelate desuccinylase family protein
MKKLISQGEIVGILQELIRCPSVNPPPETTQCAQVVADILRKNSIRADIIEARSGVANVVARLEGKKSGKRILLNGHIDVVAPGEGWTMDPYGGEVRSDLIYGRGACDMKSGIAVMLASIIAFKRSGRPFSGEIIFTAVGDEETGSRFGTKYLLEQGIANDVDLAIVTEPTDLAIELGNRGLRWFDISVKGLACHAGRPHLGINAVQYASKIVEAIHGIKLDHRDDRFEIPQPSISVTMIDGGTQVNVVPNRCRLSVDRRMIPGETSESVMHELEAAVSSVTAVQPDIDVDIRIRPESWDAYLISEEEAVVDLLKKAHFAITGQQPVIRTKLACTDASHIFHEAGVPVALYGPGIAGKSHQIDECIPVNNLIVATEVLQAFFRDTLV